MSYSRPQVAERAGADITYIQRLIDAGILDPGAGDTFTLGDVRRVRFVRNLELAGVSLDGMAAAVRQGTLSFSYLDAGAFDESFAALSATTFRELSDRTGVPLRLLSVVREAVGFAEPRPDDLVRERGERVPDDVRVVLAVDEGERSHWRPVSSPSIRAVYFSNSSVSTENWMMRSCPWNGYLRQTSTCVPATSITL